MIKIEDEKKEIVLEQQSHANARKVLFCTFKK